MNMKVYTVKELQRFNAMLTQFEAEGVTDFRFVRQLNQNEIDSRFLSKRVKMSAKAKKEARLAKKTKKPPTKVSICPDCGSDGWYLAAVEDGINYYMCRDCRYSEER